MSQRYQLREWSLIKGTGGGATKWEGGSEVLALQKQRAGRKKVLAMLKGVGAQKMFGIVFPWELEVLAILKGEWKLFAPFKRWGVGGGGVRIFTLFARGGGAKGLGPVISPLSVICDQSLSIPLRLAKPRPQMDWLWGG